jgi:3-dehydroquinate synthase
MKMENSEKMINPALTFTNNVGKAIDDAVGTMHPSSVFVLVDSNTASFVLPRMQAESTAVANATVIEVESGEQHKSLDTLATIWKRLGDNGATRRSLLINLGGGVITDMGAFAASTFKRGMRFINVPTTLLAAVDASVGGKTGINFNSLKNEVGLFSLSELTVISTTFFRTLSSHEMLSGYAEMLKHAMLSSREMVAKLTRYDITNYDSDSLLTLLEESVAVKCKYVAADFTESGLRKALNLGHTFGHAFESLALQRHTPIPHGYAVAFGMVVALVLSRMKLNFPSADMMHYVAYVAEHYGSFPITCGDYPQLLTLMHHDKKNISANEVLCTLLHSIGHVEVSVAATDDDITAALDIYRDLLHLP